jgi:RNA polymerase sigma-70 factor (ECF subfamily)
MLIGLAYRMLGSIMDAEDIVQEVFVTWEKAPQKHIRNVKSYLSKMVTNRCLDYLKSAAYRREEYIGEWLPEPIITKNNVENDPSDVFMAKESITTAYLLLLQQLSFTERTVFLLREVMAYDYDDIAEIVYKSSVNCRQIFRRAKRSLGNIPEQTVTLSSKQQALVEQFTQELQSENIDRLLHLLSPEAIVYFDAAGKTLAPLRPIFGSNRIIRLFAGILPDAPPDYWFALCEVNGQPGAIAYTGDQKFAAISFQYSNDLIEAIYIVLNPDKLKRL